MSDTSLDITCGRHGASHAAFVCKHLLEGEGKGFVAAFDPDDPRPEAWCAECDDILMDEGEWNDRSEASADFRVICANCYDEVRRRNIVYEDTQQNLTWFLENGLDRHLHQPESFYLPDRDVRERLRVGDYVKIIFLLPTKDADGEYFQGERMWVDVVEVGPLGYVGVLDSAPITEGSIRKGDRVLFGPEHVIDLMGSSG